MFYFFDPSKKSKKEKVILEKIISYAPSLIEQEAYKFVFYEPRLKIYGGAFLKQKALSSFLPPSFLGGREGKAWVLENLFIEIENSFINEDLDTFEWHCQQFFRALYEQLTNFSVTYNIPHIVTLLDKSDHEDSVLFGKWIFDWEAILEEEKVLGYLTFNRSTYRDFSDRWIDIDRRDRGKG